MNAQKSYSYYFILTMLGLLFFIFGFITWLNGTLIPYLKITCELNNFQAYFVTFAFYISYFVMALPSGWLLYKIGFRRGIGYGLFIMALGSLLFIPAAYTRQFVFFLIGLFIQGTGLALLQTAVNPYVTIIGPIESAAQRISIMGLCNKFAGILSPFILGAIVLHNITPLSNQINEVNGIQKVELLQELASRIVLPYIVMSVALFLLGLMSLKVHLPEIQIDKEEEAGVKKREVFLYPQLVLGFLAIFLYVGAEVIAADTIVLHGQAEGIILEKARYFTSFTLASMLLGYIAGIVFIPRYISQNKALAISAVLGILFTIIAILTTGFVSVFFIALLGFANAIMWPAIWPLAIQGLGKLTKIASSILIMGILGGALLPLLYGYMADVLNNKIAYIILFPCYLFIGYYALWGSQHRPIKVKARETLNTQA